MPKLLRQNAGGIDYSMVGCTLTAECRTSGYDYVKAVTLSDGDAITDGMTVIVAFRYSTVVGNAPGYQRIYSSDQVHYYTDPQLTQPFTLAPAGCYQIEYTGADNAYRYTSYPVLQVGGVTAPICDTNGHFAGGELWSSGEVAGFTYSGGKFLMTANDRAIKNYVNDRISTSITQVLNTGF